MAADGGGVVIFGLPCDLVSTGAGSASHSLAFVHRVFVFFFFTLDSDRAAPTPFHQTCHRCHTRNRDDSRKVEVRISNIEAAKALSDAVRTSLGPRGMDKMVKQADGEVIITNDGATILDKVKVRKRKRNLGVHLTYWDALSLTAFRPPLSFACRSSLCTRRSCTPRRRCWLSSRSRRT